MIQQRNISKLANRLYAEACDRVGKKLALRIQEATIERDYCLAWLLCSMTAHPVLSEALAFKGGTRCAEYISVNTDFQRTWTLRSCAI
jgi:hypothetical protein